MCQTLVLLVLRDPRAWKCCMILPSIVLKRYMHVLMYHDAFSSWVVNSGVLMSMIPMLIIELSQCEALLLSCISVANSTKYYAKLDYNHIAHRTTGTPQGCLEGTSGSLRRPVHPSRCCRGSRETCYPRGRLEHRVAADLFRRTCGGGGRPFHVQSLRDLLRCH